MLYHQKSTIKFPKKNVIDEYKEYEEALVRCFKGTQKWSDVRLLVKALQDKDNKLNAIEELCNSLEWKKGNTIKGEILQIINGEDNETT